MNHNILHKILAHKQKEIAEQRQKEPVSELCSQLENIRNTRSLADALTASSEVAVIAEIKKGSPSAGIIRENFNPEEIAQQYASNGADALSILTDEHFFQGRLGFIKEIHANVNIPVLRKDFIIDDYQIIAARAAGADAILLIVAALTPDKLHNLLSVTYDLHMQAIVEVHNENEMQRALQANAQIIGINNRNLETFSTDLGVTEKLAPLVSPGVVLVGESGVMNAEDVQRMAAAGVDAVLVGSHFMRQPDPGVALAEFKSYIQSC